jgi:hypothetical protein
MSPSPAHSIESKDEEKSIDLTEPDTPSDTPGTPSGKYAAPALTAIDTSMQRPEGALGDAVLRVLRIRMGPAKLDLDAVSGLPLSPDRS